MNIILLYLRVLGKFDPSHPEHKNYEDSTARFARTYKRFRPDIKHRLVVVDCGMNHRDTLLDDIADEYTYYNGGGYDCGTYKTIGGYLDCDMVMGLNTHTHFWRRGWLEPFAAAFEMYGPGVYGATASLQCNPHLRTPAIAFAPQVIREHPLQIVSREKAAAFESGPENLSLWSLAKGFQAKLVAADGVYDKRDWRNLPNIFRRGDQSNCLIFDRHTDIYAAASPQEKVVLEKDADNS